MIKIMVLGLNLFLSIAFASDIEVYTQTNAPWNMFVFEKAEQLMKTLGRPQQIRSFVYEEEEIYYDNTTIEEFLTPSSNLFLSRIEDISGLKIVGIKPELSLSKVGYQLYNVAPDIKISEFNDGLSMDFEVAINGMDIHAHSVNLDFVLGQLVSDEKMTALQIKMLEPKIVFDHALNMTVEVKVELVKLGDSYELRVVEVDTSKLVQQLRDAPHLFDIRFNDFWISEVALEIFGRVVAVDAEKIKSTINKNKDELKTIIIDQMAKLIEKDGIKALVSQIESFPLPPELWINTAKGGDVPLVLGIEKISKVSDQVVKVDISGDFCTEKGFSQFGQDCIESDPTVIPTFPRPSEQKQIAEEMAKNMVLNHSQLVVSVGEDYLTKLIRTLYRADIFSEIERELDIVIGPQQAILRFDSTGKRADIILDVQHRIGFWTGLVITKRNLRFPMHIMLDVAVKELEIDYEDRQGTIHQQVKMPHIVFTLKDVNLDYGKIRYGIPEYNFPSNINRTLIGTRGKVVRSIQKELMEFDYETQVLSFKNKAWDGIELPPIVFPLIKGLDLDQVQFESTGHGRGLFYFSNEKFKSMMD